jgi:hypothetical protein
MATVKYFSGTNEVLAICYMKNAEFAARFPGVRGRRVDSFSMLVGTTADKRLVPVERTITYKAFPSKHECNAKCMGGKINGTCECSCGGKNHGLGAVMGKPMAQLLAA